MPHPGIIFAACACCVRLLRSPDFLCLCAQVRGRAFRRGVFPN